MELLIILADIAKDTLNGLSSNPKYLLPKYFYNDLGSKIFQDIMRMPEYYLTDCELEIFEIYKKDISDSIGNNYDFDIIEFGSGDGIKTKVLLNQLLTDNRNFRYKPIDISRKANEDLVKVFKTEMPMLKIEAQTGDYFEVIQELNETSHNQKVILFLGSNIGNFSNKESQIFLAQLKKYTNKNDKVLIGFDMKKSPSLLMKAYSDPYGYTRDFNLNHLKRLNDELGANFKLDNFEHHTEYNPITGEIKSYLVSRIEQTVFIAALEKSIHFKQWESIFMELSRKFEVESIENLALKNGFEIVNHYTDTRNYFVDSLWIRK